jgi:tRNA (adenine22-N1)-methyltransferase
LALEKHRLYQIWLVSYGQEPEPPWVEVEWHLGRRMLEKGHPLLPELMDREEKKWQTILTQCEHKSTDEVRQRWQEAATVLKALKEVKQLDHLQRYFTDHRQ